MTSEQKKEPKLISASRRTDIPRFYARWFGNAGDRGSPRVERRLASPGGFAATRRRARLLFWTRDAGPFMKELEALRVEGIPYAFQFTINGYGRELSPVGPAGRGDRAAKCALSVSTAEAGRDGIRANGTTVFRRFVASRKA